MIGETIELIALTNSLSIPLLIWLVKKVNEVSTDIAVIKSGYSGHHSDIHILSKKVEDHEKRITKIETHLQTKTGVYHEG